MRARSRFHVNDNIHLARVRVRQRFCGNFRLVQALFAKSLSQPFQRFVHNLLSVGLPQANLHGGGCGRFGGRGRQSFEAHQVEEQVFPGHKVQPDTIGYWRYHSLQVRIISGLIKRPQTFSHSFAIQRLANFDGEA